MGDTNYAPIIHDMTWSYSRVKCFEDCPYRFYLKYILDRHGKEMFFASYGSFIHKILEKYYKGEINEQEMPLEYLSGFKDAVLGKPPSDKVFRSYFLDGLNYLKQFRPLDMKPLAIEQRFGLSLDGVPVVAVLDYIGEAEDGIHIVDNKSRKLKQPSKRKTQTKNDQLIEEYLTQLYLYSAAVQEVFGKLPASLDLNCFRSMELIKSRFDIERFEAVKHWFHESIEKIAAETDFLPDPEYFKCSYLCEMQDYCEFCDRKRG